MKKHSILMAAMAATVVLAGCAKNEEAQNNNDEANTVIINVAERTNTRAIGAPAATEASVAFTSGTLYFTDNAGVITKTVSIGSGKDIDINSSNLQHTITNVPQQSTKTYIVGNVAGLPLNGNISQIVDYAIDVTTQMGDDKNVSAVALYGTSPLEDAGTNMKKADITVNPISARIEINQFTAQINGVTDYKIDGIFINNFYEKTKLSGVKTATASDLVNNPTETTPTPEIYLIPSSKYTTAQSGKVYDFASAGIGSYASKVYKPTSGVWAYNLLAPTDGDAFPHIVIRFTGITGVPGVTPTDYKYITVSGFTNADDDSAINSFAAGRIYTITDFKFTENDLDILPEMQTITATVNVTLAEWSRISVNPIH